MIVEAVTEATDALARAMARLVPQLSGSAAPPSRADLAEMLASGVAHLLVAREAPGADVVGTLTLLLFRTPVGRRASIEDVVVDTAARGQGVGEALVRAALERAHAYGARHVDLTSGPAREAANRLYRRLGFAARETNVYRYTFGA